MPELRWVAEGLVLAWLAVWLHAQPDASMLDTVACLWVVLFWIGTIELSLTPEWKDGSK